MEVIPYIPDDYDYFLNSIVMIPEKKTGLNGFYKIVKSSKEFFYIQKMKYETLLVKTNEDNANTKTYEATITNDFEKDTFSKIKKTSVNKKYPVIICSIVRYEV